MNTTTLPATITPELLATAYEIGGLGAKEYTAALRKIIKARGITGVSITMARGTAYGWTNAEIRYVDGEGWDEYDIRAREIAALFGFGGRGLGNVPPTTADRARFVLSAHGVPMADVDAAIALPVRYWD